MSVVFWNTPMLDGSVQRAISFVAWHDGIGIGSGGKDEFHSLHLTHQSGSIDQAGILGQLRAGVQEGTENGNIAHGGRIHGFLNIQSTHDAAIRPGRTHEVNT
jgi:hypothetical protein